MKRLPSAALIVMQIVAARAAEPYPLWDNREPIASYAQRVNLPPEKSIDLGSGMKIDLVLIPAGQFTMGTSEPKQPSITVPSAQVLAVIGASLAFALLATLLKFRKRGTRFSFSLRWLLAFCLASSLIVWGVVRWRQALEQLSEYEAARASFISSPADEKTTRPVLIPAPFYMGKHETTQEQYQALTGVNPSAVKRAKHPVTLISWFDALEFCKQIRTKAKANVRLPSEAQWEYACRAGSTTVYNFGARVNVSLANYGKNARVSRDASMPVGSFKPNAFGLYDMHGNVSEWCEDEFGSFQAIRGGSWLDEPENCRSAKRDGHTAAGVDGNLGFRIVLLLD